MRFLRLGRWAPFALIVSLAISAASNTAYAFTDPEFFHKEASEGGSEGRWFTGAPSDGFGCSVCHGGKPSERVVVEGLPTSGYVPGGVYNIRIAWPDVGLRTRQAWLTAPANMLPRTTLVAEIVSETGRDNGTIIQGTLRAAQPTELCARRTERERKRMGHAIYRQTVDAGTRIVNDCVGQNFTRCLVAVRACGAEEVRFQWKAPAENEGAMWFAAGFVSTDLLNSRPDLDAVTEITIPLAPSAASGFESELGQSCAVSPAPGALRSERLPAAFGLVFLGLGICRGARSRLRRRERQ